MENKKRMLAGLPYKSWLGVLPKENARNKNLIYKYNNCNPANKKKLDKLIRKILGKTGKKIHIEAPFHCDYGYNIEVGEEFYANYNCTILDVAKVHIGNNVMFAPNVSIYTAGHPIHPETRNSGYEYGIEVSIGNNVWIGGGTIINPGVHIGDNVVIGSGSVVTKDIPENVIAVGNPCKVIRKITDEDKHYYYKDKKFDVDDYLG